ncbi:MAG: aldehyde dehydrogenase family protein [Actinomycetota bacterium]|nr:aldehyde dehydrogenase family protein [Actinomycetota bacterium]
MRSYPARLWPAWVAGSAVDIGNVVEVRHPGDGSVVGTYIAPSLQEVEQAVTAAAAVKDAARATTAAQRAAALLHVSQRLEARLDEAAWLITAENGKPIMWARAEAQRAVSTFRWAAEEARRFGGELQRLDTEVVTKGRAAIIRRFPYGPVLGISPFNFPINLVAHKLAPALAVGAPIVLKPAPATPLGALLLGELLAETDLPPGMWSVLPVGNEVAPVLVQDPRLPVISFTGSDVVGFAIQESAPRKHVILELGGNAAAIVLADYATDADLEWAATRIATFGYYQAGQSCVAVQQVMIDSTLLARFLPLLQSKVAALATGSPWEESTVVGPLISESAAERVEQWIIEAVASGARVLVGGGRSGTSVQPTLLIDVDPQSRIATQEVFGPVVSVQAITGLADAIERVNSSRFGLQTGVFTHQIQAAFRAHRDLEVGGVVIGDVPSFRSDQMPYGGVKDSGSGREGLRAAMNDFTYERVLVLSDLDL